MFKSAIIATLALATSAFGSSIVFSYTSNGSSQGSTGNNIQEIVSGETLTATAWGLTGNNGTTFQGAALGQYSGLGLGVCNANEIATCTAPQHEVDDNGSLDMVLFKFSQPISSISIVITPVCNCDTNASYLVGSNINPLGDTLAQLGTFTSSNEVTKDTTRTVTISNLGSGINSVLFGASITGTNNYFKIESVSVTEASGVPEPGTMALAGGALIGLGLIRRKRISANR